MEIAATATSTGKRDRVATLLLSGCIMGSGAAGLVNEYILSTVSTYILGSAIEQFSIIIALMMLSMGLAGWFQKFVGDDHLVEKFITIEALLAIIGGFAPLVTYAAFGFVESHFALIQYSFVVAIGALIGFEIPLLLRINERYSDTLRANLAAILSFDYVGSFVGALIWTYWLLKTFPLTESSFIVAGSNFLVAAIAFVYFARKGLVTKIRLMSVVTLAVMVALVAGYMVNRDVNVYLEQKFYDDPIKHAATTKYQRLVVTENQKTGDTRLYINGNLQFSSLDEARYHEFLVHPAMELAKRKERVLILGGGDGLALHRVMDYPEVKQAMLVDLDPDMVKLSNTIPAIRKLNGGVYDDARVVEASGAGVEDGAWKAVWQETGKVDRKGLPVTEKTADVRVMNVDADRFVESAVAGEPWDVVIVDFPDPSAIELAKLYSKEFYLKLRGLVHEDTMIVVQSTSPYHAKEAYLCIMRTLEAAGFKTVPYHVNVPSFGDWGYFIAWPGEESPEKVKKRIAGISEFSAETEYLTPELLTASLAFGKGELEAKRNEINTLMHPVLLDIYVNQSWAVD